MKKEQVYLPGLNGIRTIAAVSVVISHCLLNMNNFGVAGFPGWNFATHGVTMFFTLSGFLITYLLLEEKKISSVIHIGDFYLRRILRIWPLYFFYLGIVVAGILLTWLPGKLNGYFFFYLILAPNIPFVIGQLTNFIYHYWSLGVEEQFYIFWPWLIKQRNALRTVLIFLLCFIAVKILLRVSVPGSIAYALVTVTRFDCMAIGGLFAILLHGKLPWFLRMVYSLPFQLGGLGILLAAAFEKIPLPDFIQHNVISLASAILIINVSSNARSLINLENPLCNFVGKISFGIYVYHPLCIYLLSILVKNRLPQWNAYLTAGLVTSVVLVFVVITAWFSYTFLEKRFLLLKKRFSVIESGQIRN